MSQTKFINGSDLLISFGGSATGHATSHTLSFNSESKETATKPPANNPRSNASLFRGKRVTGLSVQIKAEGLGVYDEAESGIPDFLSKWKEGDSVEVEGFFREGDATPYISGDFIISNLEISTPAGEDTTYSITLDNDGAVNLDESKFEPSSSSGGGSEEED